MRRVRLVRRRTILRLDRDEQPLAMLLGVPVENVDQCGQRCGRIFDARVVARGFGHGRAQSRGRPGRSNSAQQVVRRLGLRKCAFVERHAEFALDARHEFGARKAVEPIVALERVIDAEALREIASRAQLVGKVAHLL